MKTKKFRDFKIYILYNYVHFILYKYLIFKISYKIYTEVEFYFSLNMTR